MSMSYEMGKRAAITLDIEKGDTLLFGRYKNSPKVVEEIGTDDKGQPTINGMKLLACRIEKLMPKKEKKAAAQDLPGMADKWSDQDHLRAALQTHLQDASGALGTDTEGKELTDLSLITEAYAKQMQDYKKMRRERLKKFLQYAKKPALKFNKPPISQEELFEKVRHLLPEGSRHASGGIPDVKGISDVDASYYTPDPKSIAALLPKGTIASPARGGSIEYQLQGHPRPVNLFATSDKDIADRSIDHRNTTVALRQFPELLQKAIELKKGGMGTEPAWAQVLGLEGDPYTSMRDTNLALEKARQLLSTKTAAWEDDILKKYYSNVDKAHTDKHVNAVRAQMAELVKKHKFPDPTLADQAALLHDIGNSVGREEHELHGRDLVLSDPDILAKIRNKKKLQLLANAIRQHRASTGKPRSMLGRLLSDADRMPLGEATAGSRLQRAVDYGKTYEPHLNDDEQWVRAAEHLAKKFGPGGVGARSYFPETSEAIQSTVAPIRELLADDKLDLKKLKALE